MCFFQNNLKYFLFNYANKGEDNLCRKCKNNVEDMKHIFIDCPVINHKKLKLACARYNIEYNVKNLLSNELLKNHVESFLHKLLL